MKNANQNTDSPISEKNLSLKVSNTFWNKNKFFLISGIVVGIFFIIVLVIILKIIIPARGPLQQASPNVQIHNGIVEKVGIEYIYPQELAEEYADYPFSQSPANTKLLLAKIARDSITLQEAQAENIITLDSSVFNSPSVDYAKRIKLVSQVQDTINNREDKINGSFVSLWFDNFSPGPVGYDKGKQIAFTTMQQLNNNVKNHLLTMVQAASAIENNRSLAKVDPHFQSNAFSSFSASASDKITFDPNFDAKIRALSPGQVTSLYLAKDKDNSGKIVDAVYMFAQVTNKTSKGQTENFDQWYAQHQKAYEITIY